MTTNQANATEELKTKYPQYIINKLRNRIGEDKDDESVDGELLELSKGQVFSHVLKWDGLMGNWDSEIKKYVKAIYGINLRDFDGD